MSFDNIALESFGLAKRAYNDFFEVTTYQGASTAVKGGQQFSPPPPQYAAHAREVCRRQAALGGYRLARLLAAHLAQPQASGARARSMGLPRKAAKKAQKRRSPAKKR